MSKSIQEFEETAAALARAGFRRPSDYDRLLNAVTPLIRVFTSAAPVDRERITSRLKPDALHALRAFAGYAPLLAVRRGCPELIRDALIAITALGRADDVRDLAFYVAAIYHSAAKLGLDTCTLFAEASACATSDELKVLIRSFPLRPPESRDLRAFWLREAITEGEFDIVPLERH